MEKNIFERKLENENDQKKSLHSSDILPNTIEQRHIKQGKLVFFGDAADRPDGSSHVKLYFATDTFVLSAWTGSAWKTITLS